MAEITDYLVPVRFASSVWESLAAVRAFSWSAQWIYDVTARKFFDQYAIALGKGWWSK